MAHGTDWCVVNDTTNAIMFPLVQSKLSALSIGAT